MSPAQKCQSLELEHEPIHEVPVPKFSTVPSRISVLILTIHSRLFEIPLKYLKILLSISTFHYPLYYKTTACKSRIYSSFQRESNVRKCDSLEDQWLDIEQYKLAMTKKMGTLRCDRPDRPKYLSGGDQRPLAWYQDESEIRDYRDCL